MEQALKVLLVDKLYEDFVSTRELLAGDRIELAWGATIESALQSIGNSDHDVYLIDEGVGQEEGLKLLREAHRLECTAPFIMISGKENLDLELRALNNGATEFLSKEHLDREALGRTIWHAVERRKAQVKMQHRLDLERLIATISLNFINLTPEEIDEGITLALQQIARFCRVEIALVALLDGEALMVTHSNGNREASDSRPLETRDLDLLLSSIRTDGDRWKVIGQQDNAGILPDVRKVVGPEINNAVILPLKYERDLAGLLALGSTAEKTWHSEDLSLMALICDVFLNALERKRNDLQARQLQRQLIQARKIQAIGQLASGIAHDLNNAMTVALGHLELIRAIHGAQGADSNEPISRSLNLAFDGCKRAARLISDLIGFSQQGRYYPRPIQVRKLLETLQTTLGGGDTGVELKIEAPSVPLTVEVDEAQVQRCLSNLVNFARDFMSGQGVITISASAENIPDAEIFNPRSQPGRYVRVSIRDNGPGLTSEQLDRIFDPFFNFGPEQITTGLSLSMVYGTMQNHGGWVDIASEPGEGTNVHLFFPLVEGDSPFSK